MWSRGCICCSPATVQQECARERLERTSSRTGPISFVECLSCNGQVCGFCIDGLLRLIAESHKDISPSDHSLVALRGMKLALSSGMVSVQLGFCCAFKKSIHPDAHLTLTKPPRSPDLPSVTNQLDDDYDFCDRETFNKRIRHALSRTPVTQAENVDFLRQYFSGTSPPITMKPADIPSVLRKMNKSRRKSGRPRYSVSELQGAFIYPEFNLLVQADATNWHLNCDHLALADSPVDSTKAVMHAVLTATNAVEVEEFIRKKGKTIARIGGKRERVVLPVTSPEDASKKVDFNVDIVRLNQVRSRDEVAHWKGMTCFEPEFIADLYFFGQKDIDHTCNCTIIIGEFTIDEGAKAPKLLLLRPSSMLCNTIFSKPERDKFSKDIYALIRSYAGRRGFEVKRTCGSSGKVSPESDRNLLYFLSYHEGILPRLAHGCVIIRGEDRYYFCYAKVTPSSSTNHVIWEYTPPKDGGQFRMPNICLSMFPPIAEMVYLKTLAVSVLVHYNQYRNENNQAAVASGPLRYERISLEEARKAYTSAPKNEAMFQFISKFNSFNNYSMVAYPVGMHCDHFKHRKESLENKILFCISPSKMNEFGRGGCIVANNFVYGLLDW